MFFNDTRFGLFDSFFSNTRFCLFDGFFVGSFHIFIERFCVLHFFNHDVLQFISVLFKKRYQVSLALTFFNDLAHNRLIICCLVVGLIAGRLVVHTAFLL